MKNNKTLPPKAKIAPTSQTWHNIENRDDYAWLRAKNWQSVLQDPSTLEPEIRQYLEAENSYQQQWMADTQAFQKDLFVEMKAKIKQDDSSVPMKDGPYYYGISFDKGGQQPNFFRSDKMDGTPHIYLNGDKESAQQSYFTFGSVNHSPDHKKALWSFDNKGSEFYTIKVRDIARVEDGEDIIEKAGPSAVWDTQSRGFFYTKLDENHRPCEVYYHALGSDETKDTLIYREADSGFFVSIQGSRLHDFVFINVHDHETSEIWLIDAQHPLKAPHCVKEREEGVQYSLTEGGDVFYILTNDTGAKDFKISMASIHQPTFDHWTEVIAHRPGCLILTIEAYRHHLVWLERFEGLPRLAILNRQTALVEHISFEEETYSLGFIGSAEYDSELIRFSYSSLTTPQKTFDYNLMSGARHLLKTQIIPSGHKSENYITKRLMASAPDGALIPVSLYYHKDTPLDGSAPCLLYGYGAYGISIPASFSTTTLSLVDRGFIYAIAHIRGGKEKGYAWYEQGKHKHKLNSFTDFIAVGRHLVAQNYTNHKKLIGYGGSAGGMLMGAVANMAAKDFLAIVAIVPFVDVLNTMLDDSLPLTPPEWPEWGNPIASKEDYALIASYSAYDNVTKQDYPHILAMAGLTDPRVTYWEAAKWVAKLRANKTDKRPVLLHTNMQAGHGGAAGRFSKLEETAFIYAYILKVSGKL